VLAKVACVRPAGIGSKYWIVGVSLEAPGNLWCIVPTPPDWGSYSEPPKFFPVSVRAFTETTFASAFNSEARKA
jgi:hypothetical protein